MSSQVDDIRSYLEYVFNVPFRVESGSSALTVLESESGGVTYLHSPDLSDDFISVSVHRARDSFPFLVVDLCHRRYHNQGEFRRALNRALSIVGSQEQRDLVKEYV